MKNIILVLLVFVGVSYASAQDVYTSSGRPGYHKKTNKQSGYDPDRLIIGGGVIASLGGGFANFGVNAIVGYRFTDRLSAGVGLGYQYFQQPDLDFSTYYTTYYDKENIIYPNLWARFTVWRGLYITGTYEHDFIQLNQPYFDVFTNTQTTVNSNVSADCLLFGVGYKQRIAGRVSFFIEVLYDVLQEQYSPYYQQLVPRAGIAAGL